MKVHIPPYAGEQKRVALKMASNETLSETVHRGDYLSGSVFYLWIKMAMSPEGVLRLRYFRITHGHKRARVAWLVEGRLGRSEAAFRSGAVSPIVVCRWAKTQGETNN